MALGRIIKAGTKQYRTVEDIDIFNMRETRQIFDLKIPVVKEASSEVRPVFSDDEEIFEQNQADEKEFIAEQPIQIKETVTIEASEIERLTNQIEELKNMISAKDNQIAELKKNFRNEGYERGRVEGYSKGQIEAQREAQKVLENIEQKIAAELAALKAESEEMWSTILDFLKKALFKITAKSIDEAFAQALTEKIRKLFPDENKLSIRVSPDLFTIFSQINRENIVITKDTTMPQKSVVAELEDGVADFSLKTQIEKIMKWLEEEHNV